MFNKLWKELSSIFNNEGGYYGKERKRRDAHEKAIADQQAQVLRDQIASNERIARETAEATERAARNSAIGGIIGAAIGANTTTRQIVERLPHERAAAAMTAMEIQQKWDTTREMKESGYSNVAIEYALQGKSHRALYADNEYATMLMKTEQRKNMIQNIQTFGIQSASNPHGVAMTADEFIEMHALKDPESMLQVDPEVARQRQAAFDKWESEMRRQGKGVLVDLYKNPGKSVNAMKGKDPLIPDDVMPFISAVAGDQKPGDINYQEILKQLNRGEKNQYTDQLKWAMEQGIVDEFGNVDHGSLLSMIPPELQNGPAFDPVRQLTDAEKAKLLDDYNKFSEIQIDPKLVREKQIGMGVSEKIKYNPDGTVAGKVMEGYMTSPTGEQIFMSIPNGSLRDWKAKETQMLSGLGPLFPGQLALSTQDEQQGRMGLDGRTNQLSKPNTGGLKGPQMTSASNPYGTGHKPNNPNPQGATYNFPAARPGTGTPTKPTSNPGTPAPNNGAAGAPTGYEGAPLAAGED